MRRRGQLLEEMGKVEKKKDFGNYSRMSIKGEELS